MNVELEPLAANASIVTVGQVKVLFSYRTPVAFHDGRRWYARENNWGPTTGRHINLVARDRERIQGDLFERMLANTIKVLAL
jgi:hypothetical protein